MIYAKLSFLYFLVIVMFLRLLCIIFFFAVTSGQAQQPTPISYRVVDNNRIFIGGDASRFVEDLHVYLRCSQSKTTGKPIDTRPDCEQYRRDGDRGGILVPNLRSEQLYKRHEAKGADRAGAPLAGNSNDYLVRYDKTYGRVTRDYVAERRRALELSLNEHWLAAAPAPPRNCRWKFESSAGEVPEIASADCRPTPIVVTLSLSSDGLRFDYSGKVTLTFELSNGETRTFSETLYTRDFLIVAMGDSFTSGEGNPERNVIPGVAPAQWLDYRCHRSVFSYPFIVASALAIADPRHSVTLVDVACSGAQTTAGLLNSYIGAISQDQARALWVSAKDVPAGWAKYGTGSAKLDPQIKQVENALSGNVPSGIGRKPELLLASIGVNDVSLVGLLDKLATTNCTQSCLDELRRWRTSESYPCDVSDAVISPESRLHRSFDCLDMLLRKVRSQVDTRLDPQKVYLTEYINPLRDEAGNICDPDNPRHKNLLRDVLLNYGAGGRICNALGTWCPWFPELTKAEVDYAYNEFLEPLRKSLSAIANDDRWSKPEYTETEQHRGFCAQPSWYHRFAESMARQGLNPGSRKESVGTLHPNTFGQYYVAVRVLSRMVRDGRFKEWGHNLGNMTGERFGNGGAGFAWYIWDKNSPDQRRDCHMYYGGNPRSDCKVP